MKSYALIVLLLASAQMSIADENNPANQSQKVIVTATRTAQTVDETLSSVTIITQEDIERQHSTSVQEILRSVAGLSVTNSGGEGQLSSLFMRGTNSSHLLVMIDGVKIGSSVSGTSAFELIPVEFIERIEIVRGPRSSLYGSEAIGGVIQIFTKKGDGTTRPTVSLSLGSYETYKTVIGLSGGDDKTHYNASLSSYDTEGFNACDGEPMVGGCFATEPDDDSYRYVAGSLAVGHQLSDRTKVSFNVLRSDADVKFDGYFNQKKSVQQASSAKLSYDVNSSWFLSFMLGETKDEAEFFSNGVFIEHTDSERSSASVQNDLIINNNAELTIGLDYQDDQVDSDSGFVKTSRLNKGLFTQYIHDLGKQDFQISARHDDNEQFESHNTGSVAWGYDVNKQTRVTLSHGTAFKAPTFLDLYYPGFNNPNLSPEESNSSEISLRRRESWGSWSANIYQTDIDELIIYNFSTSMPENLEKATIKGVEFIIQTHIINWHTQLDVTFIDPENRSDNSNKGNVLPRRAKKTARLVVSRKYGKFKLGATVIAEGRRYENATNTVELGSFKTVDLNGSYQAASNWRVGASVKNLFDENYETVDYYNQPGRNFLLSVSYQPPGL